MPDDAGVLPDVVDCGLAMDKRPGADVFGAGIEVALERGSIAREGKAFEGIVGLAGLLHVLPPAIAQRLGTIRSKLQGGSWIA